MRKSRFHPLMLLASCLPLLGAAASAAERSLQDIVDGYVREGLQANLALRMQSLEVERSQAALDEARARFYPVIGVEARYTHAQGGRTIELPLGDLVNPVYGTLNQLLAAQGRPAQFGQISNLSIAFLQEREQDTRFTLRQPVFAPAIPAALRAQRAQYVGSGFARVALARRLKRDITLAWLDIVRADKTASILESSVKLLQENLRVNESLLRNGKITEDQVLRARAEQLSVDQQLGYARNLRVQASSYLNFLLNRPLDTAIETIDINGETTRATPDLAMLRSAALAARPELELASKTIDAAQAQVAVARSALWPTVSLGVDAGIQGPNYQTGAGRNFNTVSLLLNWQLIDGGGRNAELRGARAGAHQAQIRYDELTLQVQLEVQQALDRLNTTASAVTTAMARADAARAGFRIASRKRDEGVINQVEFMDARNTLTSGELNLNLTRFELLARQAELDYATAAGTLPLDNGVPAP